MPDKLYTNKENATGKSNCNKKNIYTRNQKDIGKSKETGDELFIWPVCVNGWRNVWQKNITKSYMHVKLWRAVFTISWTQHIEEYGWYFLIHLFFFYMEKDIFHFPRELHN